MRALFFLISFLAMSCRDLGQEAIPVQGDDIKDFPGVIVKVLSDGYAIHLDPMFGAIVSLAPTNLPNEFKVDRLRVFVSGKTEEIPPNVRLIGVPLTISSITLRN